MAIPVSQILIFDPFEEDFVTMDFVDAIDTGETLSSPVVEIDPTGPTLSAPTVSGSQVQTKLTVLAAPKDHVLVFKASTSLGRKLIGAVLIQVRVAKEMARS